MYLGKVIGRVVSSVKNDVLEGKTLLLIRRLPNGPAIVAIDAVGAGAGETVTYAAGAKRRSLSSRRKCRPRRPS